MEILRYLSWAEDEGGMRRGVGIDGKGWRCGGRGQRSHNNDVVLFSHSHTLLDCTIESGLARNNCQLFSQSKQQQLRAASTTTLRPPRPRLDGPIMGPMVMAARLITTVDAGTAGVPYAS